MRSASSLDEAHSVAVILLNRGDVGGLQSLRASLDAEFDLLSFFELAVAFHLDCREVDEDVVPVLTPDKSIALHRVEPLHRTNYSIGHFLHASCSRTHPREPSSGKHNTAGIESRAVMFLGVGLGCCILHGRHGIMHTKARQGVRIRPPMPTPTGRFTPFMNIYFSCSLTGGRDDEHVYGAIVDHLLGGSHEVPTAHLARPEVMSLERVVEPNEVYRRDMEWITSCDALIAEVTTPSHGVGYEIAVALQLGKPVLCCHRRGATISKMISGNDSPRLQVRGYSDPDEALEYIDVFLAALP